MTLDSSNIKIVDDGKYELPEISTLVFLNNGGGYFVKNAKDFVDNLKVEDRQLFAYYDKQFKAPKGFTGNKKKVYIYSKNLELHDFVSLIFGICDDNGNYVCDECEAGDIQDEDF